MIVGFRKPPESPPGAVWTKEENTKCTPDQPFCLTLSEPPGAYTLIAELEKPEKSAFAVVLQNGKEIGSFAVPYWGRIDDFGRFRPIHAPFPEPDKEKLSEIRERYPLQMEKEERFCFAIPLVVRRETEEIRILCTGAVLNASMKIYNGEAFTVAGLTLLRGIREAPSAFSRVRPGKSMVDLWGWMSMTSFEHPAERVTPFAQQTQRGILEAYKWGAGNLEFLPVNRDGIALELESDGYVRSQDETWNGESVDRLITLAKEHGMLTEFFLYALYGAEFVATQMQDRQKRALFGEISRRYASVLEGKSRMNTVDGIITEAWFPIDAPDYLRRAWSTAPNLFHLISNNDGSQFEVHEAGYTPATHAYSAHWPGFETQHTGYDHAFPLLAYPKEFYQRACGTLYTYMQGCGQTEHPRKKFPRLCDVPLGITNRTVSPDWIVAQTHNFGLRQLLDESDHLAMAIGWEADEETMCPQEARRYVYAASQDPVRLAAAYYLSDTGAGGEIDLKRVTRRVFADDVTRLRARHPFPSSALALGNRFVQLLSLPERDYNVLQFDLRHTASFYGNGALVTLGLPLCVTRFEDCRFLKKEQTIAEAAGPLSIIRETSVMGSGFLSLEQTAEYTVFSDVPMVRVVLSRRMAPGNSGELNTLFGFQEYACASVEPGLVKLWDRGGVLPGLLIFHGGITPENTRFEPGTGVIFTETLSGACERRFTVFVRAGDFAAAEPDAIRQYLAGLYSEHEGGTIRVKNDSTLPGPYILRIRSASDAPYYVRESGLWQHRGAVPSQQRPGTDLVKLYLRPGETGEVCPFGDWNGVLRPGPGCLNVLAFSDYAETPDGFSCVIHLSEVSPMLASPCILLSRGGAVWLDGVPHGYRQERLIFLPQRAGRYTLRVVFGSTELPCLVSCYADVRRCACEEDSGGARLTLELAQPAWTGKDAPEEYPVVVDCRRWRLRGSDKTGRQRLTAHVGTTVWQFEREEDAQP